MQVLFETRDPQAAGLRQLAVSRLQFVLRRVRWLVPRAIVRLSDLNGPRGGVDKHCVVEVGGPTMAPIIVRERDADLYVAIDRAADRIDRATGRRIARRRAPRRGLCWTLADAGGSDAPDALHAGANPIALRRMHP